MHTASRELYHGLRSLSHRFHTGHLLRCDNRFHTGNGRPLGCFALAAYQADASISHTVRTPKCEVTPCYRTARPAGNRLQPVGPLSDGWCAKSRWHSQPGCAGAAAGGRQTGFLGIWHTARLIPCDAEPSRFINCGNEIGGSPLARYFGLDMPGRRQQEPLHSRDRSHGRAVGDGPCASANCAITNKPIANFISNFLPAEILYRESTNWVASPSSFVRSVALTVRSVVATSGHVRYTE